MSGRVVLVAVDPSDNSKFALQYYLDNVYRPDDRIVLTHCPEPPSLPTFSLKGGFRLPVEEWQSRLQDASNKLTKLEDDYRIELQTKNIKSMTFVGETKEGRKPGDGILEVAEANNAVLIVMGSRGLSPIKRAFLGSVSEYVIRNSPIPVLVCPSPK